MGEINDESPSNLILDILRRAMTSEYGIISFTALNFSFVDQKVRIAQFVYPIVKQKSDNVGLNSIYWILVQLDPHLGLLIYQRVGLCQKAPLP